MARACEFVAAVSDVVVALAIRRRCVLFKKLQVRKGRGVDGWCFMFLVMIVLEYVHRVEQTYIFARGELLGFGRIRVRGLQPASWEMRRPSRSSVTIRAICLIALFASEALFGFEDWN